MEMPEISHRNSLQFSMPRILLSLEGLALFLGTIALYLFIGGNGWLFIILLLAPDIAMLGYLVNTRIGAISYNFAHLTALPLALGIVALFMAWHLGMSLALIWLAHIGMDRTVGYGLGAFQCIGKIS